MEGSTLIIFELVLVFGAVAAFCVWELYSLRKDRQKLAEKDDGAENGSGPGYC